MGIYKKPDGSFVTLPDDQAAAAKLRGYEPASEAEYKASKSTLRAGVEGALRGATLGFGEDILKQFQQGQYEGGGASPEAADLAARKTLKLRKEENPVTSTASEFAGMAAPALLAPEATVPKLVGGGMAGVMAEGGLMGLGQLVSESTLENTPLDVERAAIGIGAGALTAGVVGKSMEKVGEGFSWGVKKLGGKTFQDFLRARADDLEAKALGIADHPYREEMLKFARESGIAGAKHSVDTAAKAARESANWGREAIGQGMEELEKTLPMSGNPELASNLATSIERDLEGKFGKSFAHEDALKWAQRFTDNIRSVDRTWPEVWAEQSDLWKAEKGSTALKEVQRQVRQTIRNFAFDEAALPSGSVPGQFLGLRKIGTDAKAAMTLADTLEARAEQLSKDGSVFSRPTEAGLFGMMAGGPVVGAGAAMSAVARDQVRKRGGFFLGSVARNLADSEVMQGVAKGLSERVKQVMLTNPGLFGASRMVFEKALMEGEEAVLDAYVREAAADPTGHVQSLLGLPPESPEEMEAAGHRLAALSAIKGGAQGVDLSIDAAVSGFIDGKSGRPSAYKATPVGDSLARMQAVKDIVSDPSKLYEALPPEVTGGAPALSAQLVNQLANGARFLDSKAPKNPYETLPESMRPEWQPSAADVQKWNRYAEAVESPAKVLEKMQHGAFLPEHAEALKAVYPALYADIQRRMFERLSVWEKPDGTAKPGKVPYQKRLMLSQMFGPQILGLQPMQVQILQSTFQKDVDAPASKGGTRPDGRQTIDAAKNQMTQAQRIESRDVGKP